MFLFCVFILEKVFLNYNLPALTNSSNEGQFLSATGMLIHNIRFSNDTLRKTALLTVSMTTPTMCKGRGTITIVYDDYDKKRPNRIYGTEPFLSSMKYDPKDNTRFVLNFTQLCVNRFVSSFFVLNDTFTQI